VKPKTTSAMPNEIKPIILVILAERIPETFNAEIIALPKMTIAEKINSIDCSFIKPVSNKTKPIRPKINGTEYFFISKAIFSITFLVN